MQRFIHDENLKRFRDLLASDIDRAKRDQVERLLKEEEARKLDPLSDPCFSEHSPRRSA